MPFYQFNSFTGKLKPGTGFQPLYPLSPIPLQKTESIMMYDTIKTKPVTITSKSNYCTDKPASLTKKIWQSQKVFQSDISKPIYLLAGKRDKFLYRFTLVYVGLCTLQSAVFFVREGIMKK